MKAIHIDAVNKTIKEIDLGTDELAEMQKAVGGYIETAIYLENGDTVFVDEEGLLKNPKHFFLVKSAHTPFAGNGVVVGGSNEYGDTMEKLSSVADIEKLVRFMSLEQVQSYYSEETAS